MHPSRSPTPITAAALVNSPEGFNRRPLLAPVLSTESLTLLYGPRGVGKSFLAHVFEPVVGRMDDLTIDAALTRVEALLRRPRSQAAGEHHSVRK